MALTMLPKVRILPMNGVFSVVMEVGEPVDGNVLSVVLGGGPSERDAKFQAQRFVMALAAALNQLKTS